MGSMTRQTTRSEIEREISSRLLDNDESALDLAVRSIVPNTLAHLKKKFGTLCTSEDYEDAMSIALYRFWDKRARIDTGKGSVAGWFYVIAKNTLIEVLRRRRGQPEASEDEEESDTPTTTPEDYEQLRLDLASALSRLSERERRIIEADLQWSEGVVESGDLARELGMSLGALRTMRSRAKRKVRHELTKLGYEIAYW
jgi:RNA polymerase sigma factor (sigma-70 family)